MKSIGNILGSIRELSHISTSMRCNKCGTIHQFVGKQYSVICHKCGLHITLSPTYLLNLKKSESNEYIQSCGLCNDTGIILIERQVDNSIGEYGYRCICKTGQGRKLSLPVVPLEYVKDRNITTDDIFNSMGTEIDHNDNPFNQGSVVQ